MLWAQGNIQPLVGLSELPYPSFVGSWWSHQPFSLMGDIIDPKSSNMNISTFNTIQTTKYAMKSGGMTATTMFQRADVGAVDKTVRKDLQKMRSAGRNDKAQREEMLLERGRKQHAHPAGAWGEMHTESCKSQESSQSLQSAQQGTKRVRWPACWDFYKDFQHLPAISLHPYLSEISHNHPHPQKNRCRGFQQLQTHCTHTSGNEVLREVGDAAHQTQSPLLLRTTSICIPVQTINRGRHLHPPAHCSGTPGRLWEVCEDVLYWL